MGTNYFENFIINRIILHEIFKRDDNRQIVTPDYSSEVTTLDGAGLIALQDRIVSALGKGSHSVQMEVTELGDESAFTKMVSLLDFEENEFIEGTQLLALGLAKAQTSRRIPGGIVVVMDGTTGANNHRFSLTLKAEIHSGFTKSAEGQKIILEYLSNLLLTPQQKFYKIGIFIENESSDDSINRTPDEFSVFVYDHNIKTKDEDHKAAQYFYETYLGCCFSPTDKKLTKDFYVHTREFINNLNQSDEVKVDLYDSLYVYLKVSQGQTIATSEFANQFLEEEFHDRYGNHMEVKGFPDHAITKDLSYLKNSLRKRKLKFTSDVQVIAPSNNFTDLVKIIDSNREKTTLEILGSLKEQQ
ncbi:MAG: nucleoid-associated protein [Candidatus Paceibacterota bacterium]